MINTKAEDLADKLSGCASEDEMRAIMNAHDEELRRLEHNLAAEKEQRMNNLKERLRKKREEREAALLMKQKKEVCYRHFCSFFFVVTKERAGYENGPKMDVLIRCKFLS
jgi:hypothetical protein